MHRVPGASLEGMTFQNLNFPLGGACSFAGLLSMDSRNMHDVLSYLLLHA